MCLFRKLVNNYKEGCNLQIIIVIRYVLEIGYHWGLYSSFYKFKNLQLYAYMTPTYVRGKYNC